MAIPPPLNQQPKKRGCAKGCLFTAIVGFVAVIFFGFVGNQISAMAWKNERASVISSVQQALDENNHDKALTIISSHADHDDAELKSFTEKAQRLKRKAVERARQDIIDQLIVEIRTSEGAGRKSKLEQLMALDPNTQEFPDELKTMREMIDKREKSAKAEREAEVKRKEEARKEEARLAKEARLAEFKWKYQVSEDQLTSKPTYIAWVKSLNQVNFDFPYQGVQRGELMLRTHPQHGKDLILKVQKGQMLVWSYEDTKVKVVFDKGSPITYQVVGPSDHGTKSLFFRDYHGFVSRMLKAKQVKISAPFYQEGDVVFEFNVSDFNSAKYLGKINENN